MTLPLYQVDAFTDTPYRGNPAAVVIMDGPRDDAWMRSVAAEMNLSETAFVSPLGEDRFGLRWFTPTVEVDLCGHATLAASHVLWETGRLDADRSAVYDTRSGELAARRVEGWVELDFPLDTPGEIEMPDGNARALGSEPVAAARGRDDVLFELCDENAVRHLTPDLAAIARLGSRGVIVTARADSDAYHFVSRFFGPNCGIDEDPVTGSAHCTLGPWWAAKLNTNDLVGHQVSARGGVVRVIVDRARDRALLRGRAVTVLRGELTCL